MAKNDHPAVKHVDARAAAQETSVREFYEREANLRPTPTQRENDLARVGALNIDDKEDDGSESEEDATRRMLESRIPGNNPYDTRALDAGETRRRPGRPAKSE